MTRSTVRAGCLALVLAVSGAAIAGAQDTSRTRRPVSAGVTPAGQVAVSTYNAPAGDTAITRLEQFLSQYPQSPLRPRALFQLAELLARRADERFAQSQRSSATSDIAARTDYS